ncbi:MAG: 4Fe-4S dicluster domain-containing protein [Anaerolineae bacterium]|nr:4Fe-4S dicluster domain-containing protein [Anaerolineae bacterium]
MAYVITSKCERAGECALVCPVEAIHFVEDDPDWPTYYINPEDCIECGACEAECPHDAIFHQDEVPEEWQEDIAKNQEYYTTGPGQDQL